MSECPSPPSWPITPIERKWDQADRLEEISGDSDIWRVSDMQKLVEDLPEFDVPLAFLNLGRPNFNSTDEEGLYGFAQHMKHVMEADLSVPVIFGPCGEIMDGRHRIVKALLEGRATIKGKRIPFGTRPTFRK